ncbi:hypothetical protein HLB44_20760 [Aquincola sp. S2]|uniref:YkuD domain-containing protein n=1 Tax=Pseudaquabacterium terrae TaxID=2732868 RepID=A0ABX2ELF2_9BURK|nr:hypothetical protein [Aquabacterium terrae]NRF69436.1 hypothetical protein [Aquabacterium terrae]
MPDIGYIAGGADGWLNVKKDPDGQVIALPQYLSVEISENRLGREYFVVREGSHRGQACSVVAGNLKFGNPGYRAAARVEFSLSRQLLSFPGGQARAITDAANPIPLGTHPIQLPDFPHELGAGYMSQSRFAMTWFYMGRGPAVRGRNDRYLHTGRVSAGCVTVDPSDWTALYQALILSRNNDGATLGSIAVLR